MATFTQVLVRERQALKVAAQKFGWCSELNYDSGRVSREHYMRCGFHMLQAHDGLCSVDSIGKPSAAFDREIQVSTAQNYLTACREHEMQYQAFSTRQTYLLGRVQLVCQPRSHAHTTTAPTLPTRLDTLHATPKAVPETD